MAGKLWNLPLDRPGWLWSKKVVVKDQQSKGLGMTRLFEEVDPEFPGRVGFRVRLFESSFLEVGFQHQGVDLRVRRCWLRVIVPLRRTRAF